MLALTRVAFSYAGFGGVVMRSETGTEPTRASGRSGRSFTIFLVFACVALSVEVALLIRKNRSLEKRISQVIAAEKVVTLMPGDEFEPVALVDESGEEMLLDFGYGQPKSLLLMFTMGCAACEETFPVWSEIVPAASIPGLRVVAIRLDNRDALEEEAANILPFPVHSVVAGEETLLRKVSHVPATLLLDEFGVVESVWSGVLTPEKAEDLDATIAAIIQLGD